MITILRRNDEGNYLLPNETRLWFSSSDVEVLEENLPGYDDDEVKIKIHLTPDQEDIVQSLRFEDEKIEYDGYIYENRIELAHAILYPR